nr:MAG TPA: hypothetical protein [Caudoviricetes sp.]DAG49370.1 MAG TPA: hypothetical protein [Caudoviricetes sp.]
MILCVAGCIIRYKEKSPQRSPQLRAHSFN